MEVVMRSSSVTLVVMFLVSMLFLGGCSTKSFLVMEDGPKGYLPTQSLGVRAGVDTGSLSPTERYSWLEICDRVEKPTFFGLHTEKNYVNCEVAVQHMAQAARTTTTGYIAGVVGPVIQTGLTAGAVAYTGHAIGKGIGRSGDNIQTTTTNSTSSNGGTANGGSAYAKGGQGGDAVNFNSNSAKSGSSAGAYSGSSSYSESKVGPITNHASGGSIGGVNQNVNSGAANGNGTINVGH